MAHVAVHPRAQEAPPRGWWRSNQQWLTPWLFLAPGMFMFGVYVIWPIIDSFWLSFFDWDGLGEKRWLGWGNYLELFDDPAFYTSLRLLRLIMKMNFYP